MAGPELKDTDTCSFCNKPRSKVKVLIAGQGGIFICNECVDRCNEIIAHSERGEGDA